MNNIEVRLLNPRAVHEAEKIAVCAAKLTQGGHKIQNMDDFMNLYHSDVTAGMVSRLSRLPHPTLQKFEVINVAIVGASRRFLAQITRHQNEVKFMSASLQYSDYAEDAQFVVPCEILTNEEAKAEYLAGCQKSMAAYKNIVAITGDNDAAGYAAPQGLRNVLIISATPYQWKHMISQRICRRNTPETRYVMLLIWQELLKESVSLFADAGAFCMNGTCKEGKMTCADPILSHLPSEIIKTDFPELLQKEEVNEE